LVYILTTGCTELEERQNRQTAALDTAKLELERIVYYQRKALNPIRKTIQLIINRHGKSQFFRFRIAVGA
jgi:hypothetical protein